MAKTRTPMLVYNIMIVVLLAATAVSLTACKKKSPTSPSDGGTPGTGGSILTPSPGPMEFFSPDRLARITILTIPGPGSQLMAGSTPPISIEYWQDLFDEGVFMVYVSNDGISLVADPIITDTKTDGFMHSPFAYLSRDLPEGTSRPRVRKGQTAVASIGINNTFTPGVSGALTEINFLAFTFGDKRLGVSWEAPGLCKTVAGGRTCNYWQIAVPVNWKVIRNY